MYWYNYYCRYKVPTNIVACRDVCIICISCYLTGRTKCHSGMIKYVGMSPKYQIYGR